MARRQWLPLVALIAAASLSLAAADDCKDAKVDSACVNFVPIPNGSEQTCAGAGGGGQATTATPVPTATATRVPSYWETRGGDYSYGSTCQDGTEIDPITTIFLTTTTSPNDSLQLAHDRLLEIGMTSDFNALWTTRQSFRDEGGCVEGEITRATNEGWHPCADLPPICVDSRWHTRCNLYSVASPYGYWLTCTPHWDEPGCPNSAGVKSHYVPSIFRGPGGFTGTGFDAGRDWTWWQLVHQYGMPDLGTVFYDNRMLHRQCNGDLTNTDGRVNVIQLR